MSSPPNTDTRPTSSSVSPSAPHVIDELNRLSTIVAQPGSFSSFQQLRRTLGDDAAFVVMDYFIDIRTLHDQCVELKTHDANCHAAVLRALLLHSEDATPFELLPSTPCPSPRNLVRAKAEALLAAVGQVSTVDFLAHIPKLRFARKHIQGVNCLRHTINRYVDISFGYGTQQHKCQFGGDMSDMGLQPAEGSTAAGEWTPLPMNAAKLVMFSIMAHSYYDIYKIPHCTQQLINLRAIFDSVAFVPARLRSLSVQGRRSLVEAGFKGGG